METKKFKSLFLKNVEKQLDGLIAMGYFFNCKHDIHDGCLINPGAQCEDCYSGDTEFEMKDGDAIKSIFRETALQYKKETGDDLLKGHKRYEDDEDADEEDDDDQVEFPVEEKDEEDEHEIKIDTLPVCPYDELIRLSRSNKKVIFTDDEIYTLLKLSEEFDVIHGESGTVIPLKSLLLYDTEKRNVTINSRVYNWDALFSAGLDHYFYVLSTTFVSSTFEIAFYESYVSQALSILKKAEDRD